MVLELTTFPLGTDRVGIVTTTGPTSSTEWSTPGSDTPTVAWVDGCSFQVRTPEEVQNIETTTVMEYAECFMPSSDGSVVTSTGSVDFTTISSGKTLREFATGRDYLMRGDAVFEGQPSPHVFARCERQVG